MGTPDITLWLSLLVLPTFACFWLPWLVFAYLCLPVLTLLYLSLPLLTGTGPYCALPGALVGPTRLYFEFEDYYNAWQHNSTSTTTYHHQKVTSFINHGTVFMPSADWGRDNQVKICTSRYKWTWVDQTEIHIKLGAFHILRRTFWGFWHPLVVTGDYAKKYTSSIL